MTALPALWRREFASYRLADLQADLLAGLTVAAVALPLALAFGVASGADAAAGLVTAIVAGIVIAGLGGAPSQISGPTGAMSAVLIVVAARHGLPGVWLASVMAGLIILALGLFRLGRVITFIPSPVITGFTSGIALIIAIGQIDNVLGVDGRPSESALAKLYLYAIDFPRPHGPSVLIALVVVATMLAVPRMAPHLPEALRRVPGSLIGIVIATILVAALGWDVAVIGEIPRSIVLEHRLTLASLDPRVFGDLLLPAVSIAALGAIESLLCGAVAGNMTGTKMDNNQELIAQGIGNVVVPFFGGVPATAAIARTSVAVKSGARTRLTSVVHSLALLGAALIAGPLIARIPLAALGGVLVVTAVRMNEWEAIRFFVHGRHRHAVIAMLATMLATVALDLTQAIVIGIAASALFFLRQASAIAVSSESVDLERMRDRGHELEAADPSVKVIYVSGPLFFGSVHAFLEAFEGMPTSARVILSMRGVPSVDATGLQAIAEIVHRQHGGGGEVHLSGLQPGVVRAIGRSAVGALLGEDRFHWSADGAIVAVHRPDEPSDSVRAGTAAS
jgi:SulP family sulfate permease